MGDNVWNPLLEIIISNPEKGALIMVLIAGVWRWIKEFRSEAKSDEDHSSFIDTLLAENRQLRAELKEARAEAKELRADVKRRSQDEPRSIRPPH